MVARRTHTERIALPWERHGRPWRGAGGGSGLRVALVGLVAFAAAWGLFRHTAEQIRVRDTEVAISQMRAAIDRFRLDVGRCPASTSELIHPPLAQKHYLDAVPLDGWGRPLSMRCPGAFGDDPDVVSAGPSGSLLKDDNIQ